MSKPRIGLIALLLLAGVFGAAEEDIPRQRYYRSSKTKHTLGGVRRGVESLFTPVKKLTHFAERVDLPNRIRDFFYNDDYTAAFFPAFSFGGELGGFAAGVDAFDRDVFGKRKVLRGGFLIRDANALRLKAAYDDPRIGPSRLRWGIQTTYQRDDDVEIYSRGEHLGVFTRTEDMGSFDLNRFEGRVHVARRWGRWDSGLYGRGVRGHAEAGAGGGVPLPATLNGFDQVVHLAGGGAQLEWDHRDHTERPTLGTALAASGGVVGSPDQARSGESYRYSEYHAKATQFFTLFRPRRILALHTALDRVDPVNGGAIPFYELPVLDKNHGARNFPRGRFRDRGALAGNLEYRYPIWVSWDAYLFFDAAQTFGTYSQLRSNHFRYSEGFGIRFGNIDRVFFNFAVALGREKPQVGIEFSQVF